jgi:predicted Zn-dependent peptidase
MKINSVVERTELDNGIRIVTERMPFVRSVSIGIWVAAGVVNETLDNNGISHFLEHMLFKGTSKRNAHEIAKSLEIYGGGLNGSTGKEASIYTAHILDEQLELAIDVLTDLIQNPKFDADDIALEKNIVFSEISHSKEDPEELLFDNFYQNVFEDQPLGYFIHGREKIISNLHSNNLQEYLDTYYSPNKLVFSVAGNVEHQAVVELVSKYFVKQANNHKLELDAVSLTMKQYDIVEMNGFQQAHILVGGRAFSITDENRYIISMLDMLLGGGMSSRLFQNIREKYGFAYSVFSFVELLRSTGIYGAYMGCEVDKVEQSIELLKNEFKNLASCQISQQELEQLQSQIKGNILLGLESSSRRMRRIGENEFYNNPHLDIETVLSKIQNIKPNDLLGVAQQVYSEDKLCVTIIKPK